MFIDDKDDLYDQIRYYRNKIKEMSKMLNDLQKNFDKMIPAMIAVLDVLETWQEQKESEE